MKPDPKERPLPAELNATLQQYRSLDSYNPRYMNPKFPILSFLYAVYAGGENALYCDFTQEFVEKYLSSTPEGNQVKKIFDELEPYRFNEPPPEVSMEQWRRIWGYMLVELTQKDMPKPFW